jgi:hypothetical protein
MMDYGGSKSPTSQQQVPVLSLLRLLCRLILDILRDALLFLFVFLLSSMICVCVLSNSSELQHPRNCLPNQVVVQSIDEGLLSAIVNCIQQHQSF